MAVKFDIRLAADISVWNGVPAFVPPYMGVAAGFMPVRPFTGFTGNKRQGSQVWFSSVSKMLRRLPESLVIEFFYRFSDSGI